MMNAGVGNKLAEGPSAQLVLGLVPVVAALLLAGLNLLGWAAGGIVLLTRVKADWPAMTPWTSALLAGSAIGLLAQWGTQPPHGRVTAGRAAAVVVLLLCGFFATEYLLDRDSGLDQLLFSDAVSEVVSTWPGRPSPQTLVGAAALASLVLLARVHSRAADRAWPWLMAVAWLIPALVVGGYLFQTLDLVSITPWTGMSVLTAFGLLLLSFSLVMFRPDRWPLAAILRLPTPALMLRPLATVLATPLLIWVIREIALALGADATAAWVWSLLVATVIAGMLMARFVSAQQLASAEVTRSRNLLQSTYDAIFEPTVLLRSAKAATDAEPDFMILAANTAAREGMGSDGRDPVGAVLSQFSVPVAGQTLRARYRDSLQTGQPLELDDSQDLAGGSGSARWLDIRAVPTKDGHLALTWRDVTQRHEVAEQLRSSAIRAESAAQAKSIFLASMSHELRTPLHAVVGTLSLLAGSGLDQGQLALVRQGQGSAKHLLRVINDILDYSKLEAGKLEARRAPFSLEEVVRDVGLMMASSVPGRAVELHVDLDPQLPSLLLGDELRIRQVLMNLAGNAVKFTDRGSVVLSVDLLGVDEGEAEMRFEVRDTGSGMTQTELDRVFDEFAQADTPRSAAGGGTGLGLTIAGRLVRLMGGDIQAGSEPDQGSTFWFTLRLPVERHDAPEASGPPPPTPGPALLVGGSRTGRSIATRALESQGWSVTAVHPEHAAAEARSASPPFALVAVDCSGEQDDGALAELGQVIRGAGGPPVIALTDPAGSIRAPADGSTGLVDAQLVVPYTPTSLRDVIAHVQDPSAAPTSGAARSSAEQALSGMSVLVADDNDINREVAGSLLTREGARVTVARDGREAVTAVVAADAHFDAVLMDIHMPVLDGVDATREIRQRLPEADLPIIAMTASAWDEDWQVAAAAGMTDHLGKPFEPADLVTVLRRWVAPSGQPRTEESGYVGPTPVVGVTGVWALDANGGPALGTPGAPSAPGSLDTPDTPDTPEPILDAGEALARFGGDEQFYSDTLARLPARVATWRSALDSAAAGGDPNGMAAIAHNIKGSAATLGARALSAAAADLESRIRGGGDADSWTPLVAALQEAMSAAVDEVLRRNG